MNIGMSTTNVNKKFVVKFKKKVAINKRYKLYNDFVSSNDGMILSEKDLLT